MGKYQILIGLALVALAILVAAIIIRPNRYTAAAGVRGTVIVDAATGEIKGAY